MAKTFSLPRGLVIRIEIFGLVFLAALLVGLCSGCGDGTEPDGSSDSGTATKTGTSTVTCSIPGSGVTTTPHEPGLPPVQFLTTSASVSCSGIKATFPSLKSFTCAELAGNALSVPSSLSPCCIFGTKNVSTGYLDNPQVVCVTASGEEEGQYALCSTSGTFLGWICYNTFVQFGK